MNIKDIKNAIEAVRRMIPPLRFLYNSSGELCGFRLGQIQLVWVETSTLTTSSTAGNVYFANATVTWPYEFAETPKIFLGAKFGANAHVWPGRYYSASSTQSGVTLIGSASNGQGTITAFAIGRWANDN